MTKTQDILNKIHRRIRARPLRGAQTAPLQCLLCVERARVTLCHSYSDHYEMLCFEHLGEFLKTWADPYVCEWTVVRL